MSIPPAWHPDPTGRHDHRWWDGTRWTEHVADAGVASVDPVDTPSQSGADAGAPTGGERWQRPGEAGPTGGGASAGGGWASPEPQGGGSWDAGQPAAGGTAWSEQAAPAGPPAPTTRDGLAVAAGVVGIAALALFWTVIVGLVGGVVAIVLGAVAMGRVRRSQRKGRGLAITGLVTGIVAVAVSIAMAVFYWGVMTDFDRCLEFTDDVQRCREFQEQFG